MKFLGVIKGLRELDGGSRVIDVDFGHPTVHTSIWLHEDVDIKPLDLGDEVSILVIKVVTDD